MKKVGLSFSANVREGKKMKNLYLLMLSIVTKATVRTGAALHGHWCMGRSFMLPGVWSIDSLTSALREAADGLEIWARVPAVIHTCYHSVKKEKKESLVGQAWLNHIKGVGKRQVVLGVTLVMLWARLTQKCGYMRFKACSTPFSIMGIIFI